MRRSRSLLHLSLILFLILILASTSYAINIRRDVLDNGLVLLMVERHNLPLVIVKVGIKAGSVVEPSNMAGLSNLTAELLKSGTIKRSAHQIDEEIEFVGGMLDVSGGDDYITISLAVLKKDIKLGFDLLSDIILNPTFPEDEIKKRIEIIKGRIKASEDEPGFVASRRFKKEVFGGHPYGRLVMGDEEGLGRITRGDIIDFHRSYYVPNNSIISVVGDVDINEVKSLMNQYFSDWKPHDIKIPEISPPLIGEKGKTVIIDKELTQANIIIGHAGVKRDHPDYYAISLMNYILGGGGFSSRLMQNIRDEKGLVYDISSSYSSKGYGGLFEITLQTKNESAGEGIKEVLKEVERLRGGTISDKEIEDARAFLIDSFPMRIETGRRIADFLIGVEYYKLGMDYIDKYPDYIKGVTKDDIQRVAREYLKPEGFIFILVGDKKKINTD